MSTNIICFRTCHSFLRNRRHLHDGDDNGHRYRCIHASTTLMRWTGRTATWWSLLFKHTHTLEGGSKTLLGLGPVHDGPDVLEVVDLDVLVVEVEGVLPDVNAEDGDVG